MIEEIKREKEKERLKCHLDIVANDIHYLELCAARKVPIPSPNHVANMRSRYYSEILHHLNFNHISTYESVLLRLDEGDSLSRNDIPGLQKARTQIQFYCAGE